MKRRADLHACVMGWAQTICSLCVFFTFCMKFLSENCAVLPVCLRTVLLEMRVGRDGASSKLEKTVRVGPKLWLCYLSLI